MSTRNIKTFVWVALVWCVLSICASPLAAEESAKGWTEGKVSAATPKDFIPSLGEEEAYIERYTLSMDLDGGGWIGAYFTISNLGFGNGHGAARVRIKLPDRKDGNYSYFKKVDRDKWTYKKDVLDLDIAGLKIVAKDAKTFTLTFDSPDDEVKIELEVTNTLPMWKPGRGRIDVADGGYLAYGLLSPRGSAKGRVFIDGAWREITVTRNLFADHTATNIAPFDLGDMFAHSRAYEDKITVAWRAIKLSEKYGGKTFTWVMVGYKDDVVFSDANAKLRTGDTKRDKKTGYTIPYSVQIDGTQGEKGDSVKLIWRADKMFREDLLAKYGTAAKLVAGAVSKPWRYEFKSKFSMQLKVSGSTAKVAGEGRYYFDFMNP